MAEEAVSLESQVTELEEEPKTVIKTGAEAESKSELKEGVESNDLNTIRTTKPGVKRLLLTLSVALSFLLGAPFLLKSIEIYRSPLPFGDIDSLSKKIESTPLRFPCNFQAVFLGIDNDGSGNPVADRLRLAIREEMRTLIPRDFICGSCSDNFTLSVTVDYGPNCVRSQLDGPSSLWRCGAVTAAAFNENDDEGIDELLVDLLRECESKVYTLVVVNKGDGIFRAAAGKYRHAWILERVSNVDGMILRVAETFVKVFMNGGNDEGAIHGEFMPVGADGKVVLSFNLLNADPNDWVYEWNFQSAEDTLLTPIIEALGSVADFSVESQVLYHTPKASFSYWDDRRNSYIFNTKDLPFFVNSNEWHLDASIAAGGRSKILHFVIYVPSAKECPLLLELPSGEISTTNGFISPMWGGVIVLNPPGCFQDSESMQHSRHEIYLKELEKIFEVFTGQLRHLFGLKSDSSYSSALGPIQLLVSPSGFAEWELDVLSRHHTCFNLISCSTSLGSLSRLVQSLPRMIIMNEIGKQVHLSLEAAELAQSNASLGAYDASAVASRHARTLAEDAFFHPSIMSVSYYSFEHCFAVYSPFFLPVLLHVLLASIREVRRYKQENGKYLAGKLKANG